MIKPQTVPGRATRIGVSFCEGPECPYPHLVLYDADDHGYADAVIDEGVLRSLIAQLDRAIKEGKP